MCHYQLLRQRSATGYHSEVVRSRRELADVKRVIMIASRDGAIHHSHAGAPEDIEERHLHPVERAGRKNDLRFLIHRVRDDGDIQRLRYARWRNTSSRAGYGLRFRTG